MICIVFLDQILVEEMKEAVVACHRKAALSVDEVEEVGVVVVRQLTDSTHLGKSKTFFQKKIVLQNEDETNRQRSVHLTTRTRE